VTDVEVRRLTAPVHEVDDLNAFIELAYEQGWTDGLPVYPPTDDRVEAMIDYLGRDPQEVIGVMPPGEGIATIEKIAINAVMAGCKPEYMPIIVTAVEALLDPRFELLRVQATTAGPAPLTIVSGPVVKQLDFNYGAGTFTGTGHRANATIGRAIRLILWNIGYGRPGQMSQATMGHPGRYAYLVAERPPDDANPWEPFHVTNGLQTEDNAVSVFPSVTHYQITPAIGTQTFDNSVFVILDSILHLGNFRAATQKMLVLNPQAVQILNDAGWSKARFRDYILERAYRPVRDIKRTGGLSITYKHHWTKIVDPEDDDALVPSMMGPEGLQILVSGGWGSASSQSAWLDSVHGELVTRKIDWSWE
jgi:hypothetical protein